MAIKEDILEELKLVKKKVSDLDRELHIFREEYVDTHLSKEERETLKNAFEEDKQEKTIPLADIDKRPRVY
ncbi:MAG: hypothetical protein Q8R00_01840 [Candidatus Nanoarchaeia archaeon]|nr:hypothetical protein [Candidatus Nanoarchaeia archaeon]